MRPEQHTSLSMPHACPTADVRKAAGALAIPTMQLKLPLLAARCHTICSKLVAGSHAPVLRALAQCHYITCHQCSKRMQGEKVEGEYDLQRFRPLLQEVLQAQAAGTLSQNEYPYVNPPSDTGHPHWISWHPMVHSSLQCPSCSQQMLMVPLCMSDLLRTCRCTRHLSPGHVLTCNVAGRHDQQCKGGERAHQAPSRSLGQQSQGRRGCRSPAGEAPNLPLHGQKSLCLCWLLMAWYCREQGALTMHKAQGQMAASV